MHDLVQQMAWDIVCQEFPKDSGKRSRLWSAQDSYHVLKYSTSARHIFLRVSNLFLMGLESLLSNFMLQKLVELDMRSNKLKELSHVVQLDQNVRNNLMTEMRIRILCSATMSKREEVVEEGSSGRAVKLCCPGSEILKWFNHKEEGSSINMKLPRQWYNDTFLGFAICVVAAFEGNCSKCCHPSNFRCKFHIKGKNDERSITRLAIHIYQSEQDNKIFSDLDHMHIFYSYEDYNDDDLNAEEASFEFFSNEWKKRGGKCLDCSGCRVKRCGVRMLYMKDAEEMGIVANDEHMHVACESINAAAMVEPPAEPSGVEIYLNIKNNWESCSFDLGLNSYESSFVGQKVDTSLNSNHFKEEHASADNPVTDFFDSETD